MDMKQLADLVGVEVARALKENEEKRASKAPAITPVEPEVKAKSERDREDVEKNGSRFGRAILYTLRAEGNIEKAQEMARADGYVRFADDWQESKALGVSVLGSGAGYFAPELSSEVVDGLLAMSVVRRAGAQSLPMKGALVVPYEDTLPTPAYATESANIVVSEGTEGQLNFRERKLSCVTPMSNDFLLQGGPAIERRITRQLSRAMADKEDATFLFSAGVSGQPKGMYHWVDASNTTTSAGTSAANIATDLAKLWRFIREQNVPMEGPMALFMAPRSEFYLKQLLDANSNYIYRQEMVQNGTVLGIPYFSTTNIDTDISGNQSYIMLAAMDTVTIAEAQGLEIKVFPDGAYYDGSAVQSGISRDQSVVRATARHDFGCLYRGKELASITAVTWGV